MAPLPRVARNVRALVQAYQRALDRSPTATNAVAGLVLASAGDATTQMVCSGRGTGCTAVGTVQPARTAAPARGTIMGPQHWLSAPTAAKSPPCEGAAGIVLASAADRDCAQLVERRPHFDGRRCAAFAIFTAGFAGVFYTRWYRYLDRVFGTRTNPGVLAKKIAAENVVMTPLFYFPVFFFTTGVIRGKSLPQCWATLTEQFMCAARSLPAPCAAPWPRSWPHCVLTRTPPPLRSEVNKHSLSLWLVADVVLFGVIPVQFRPLFGISVEFLWINILSFVTNRDKPPAGADGPGRDDTEPVPPRVHPKVHHALEEDTGALAAQLATSSVRD